MKKLICGPMATLSHEAFRRLVERFGGVDEYYTEMINAPTLLQNGPFEKYYLMNGPCPEKIVWQLTSSDAEAMAKAAGLLARRGGIGVDINMACPAPEIVKSGAGLAWLFKSVDERLAMIFKVREAMNAATAGGSVDASAAPNGNATSSTAATAPRLSVKLRLGGEDFSEKEFFGFCAALADCGVGQVVLHPRTQKEKLTRPPRRRFVQELAELLKEKNVGVVYNGNVTDKASAEIALKECPDVAGLMIARASVKNPWIFAELRASMPKSFSDNDSIERPAVAERPAVLKRTDTEHPACSREIDLLRLGLDYIADLQKYQPPEFFKTRMQRFFAYYCDNFSFAHYIKMKMLNCKTPEQAEAAFRAYFDEMPADRILRLNRQSLPE